MAKSWLNRQRRLAMASIGAILAMPLVAAPLPYDEKANPGADLRAALAAARQANKRVLIVFGANWCPDCRALDAELRSGDTAKLVAERYVVVKVDIGNFDKNLDFCGLYGKPIEKGIPSVVVVTAANQIVYATRAGELSSARRMGAHGIYDFFKSIADKTSSS